MCFTQSPLRHASEKQLADARMPVGPEHEEVCGQFVEGLSKHAAHVPARGAEESDSDLDAIARKVTGKILATRVLEVGVVSILVDHQDPDLFGRGEERHRVPDRASCLRGCVPAEGDASTQGTLWIERGREKKGRATRSQHQLLWKVRQRAPVRAERARTESPA